MSPNKKNPLLLVLGIRPDVIRASLIIGKLRDALGDGFIFVWSGQHYSDNLKDIFFRQLGLGSPDVELSIESKTEPHFIGEWIRRFGDLVESVEPCATAFLGDTNTVLGTIASASHNVPIVHIEGCMRSYDWRMPEEKYRTVADHLSDVIYTYLDEYKEQGLLEGLNADQIVVTGNPIVDVLNDYFYSGKIRMSSNELKDLRDNLGIDSCEYSLMTCHRRENVESRSALKNILDLAAKSPHPVIFPASYRTQRSIEKFGLPIPANVNVIDPIGYVELLELMTESEFVLTDSGTVVEETAVLQVPSVQMRSSTERPQVYDSGSSIKFDPHIVWTNEEKVGVIEAAQARTNLNWEHGLGDGRASDRIVDDLLVRISASEGFRGHDPVGTNRNYSRNQGLGLTGLGGWSTQIE